MTQPRRGEAAPAATPIDPARPRAGADAHPLALTLTLSHLTFTGADDAVDPAALARLSAEAPLIEWGILLSREDEGRPRFPGRAWREAFSRAAPQARCAAHVCGPSLLAAAAVDGVPGPYQRLQLNFDRRTLPAGMLRAWLAAFRRAGPAGPGGWPPVWITQHNAANADLHQRFVQDGASPRHAVLFDASGGQGIVPPHWPAALPGLDCGYAGGLGPATLAQALPRIAAAAARGDRHRACWIDMEGGLRSGNRFDLDRVRQAIDAVRAFAGGPLLPGVRLSFPATVPAR